MTADCHVSNWDISDGSDTGTQLFYCASSVNQALIDWNVNNSVTNKAEYCAQFETLFFCTSLLLVRLEARFLYKLPSLFSGSCCSVPKQQFWSIQENKRNYIKETLPTTLLCTPLHLYLVRQKDSVCIRKALILWLKHPATYQPVVQCLDTSRIKSHP